MTCFLWFHSFRSVTIGNALCYWNPNGIYSIFYEAIALFVLSTIGFPLCSLFETKASSLWAKHLSGVGGGGGGGRTMPCKKSVLTDVPPPTKVWRSKYQCKKTFQFWSLSVSCFYEKCGVTQPWYSLCSVWTMALWDVRPLRGKLVLSGPAE